MPSIAMTLPYMRASLIHIPRRDLVLSAADNLLLRITVVDDDDPCAKALELTGGIGGPECRLLVYPDSPWGPCDYGARPIAPGRVLWSGPGTVADAVGSFDIAIPVGAMGGWPRRCAWSVLLDWEGGTHAELLAEGNLHVRPTGQRMMPAAIPLLTDTFVPVLI